MRLCGLSIVHTRKNDTKRPQRRPPAPSISLQHSTTPSTHRPRPPIPPHNPRPLHTHAVHSRPSLLRPLPPKAPKSCGFRRLCGFPPGSRAFKSESSLNRSERSPLPPSPSSFKATAFGSFRASTSCILSANVSTGMEVVRGRKALAAGPCRAFFSPPRRLLSLHFHLLLLALAILFCSHNVVARRPYPSFVSSSLSNKSLLKHRFTLRPLCFVKTRISSSPLPKLPLTSSFPLFAATDQNKKESPAEKNTGNGPGELRKLLTNDTKEKPLLVYLTLISIALLALGRPPPFLPSSLHVCLSPFFRFKFQH